MDSIAGIEIFPLISLIIFFVFFIGLIIYVWKADKERFQKISRLPLDLNEDDNEQA
jgi:cytochrome c oxidase cbb3-type subunit 3